MRVGRLRTSPVARVADLRERTSEEKASYLLSGEELETLALERPTDAVASLIRATAEARTAEVRIASEPTEPGAGRGFDRLLEGVVDFSQGRARLETKSGGVPNEKTLVLGGALYRSRDGENWQLVTRNEGGRDNLTAEGFGLLALARGAERALEVVPDEGGGLFLRLLVRLTPLFDDLSATDVLQVPTALLVEPLEARIDLDAAGRVSRFSIESAKRPRLAVQRRRFRLEFSNFGVPVEVEPPDPGRVTLSGRRPGPLRRLGRRLGYPASS